MSDQAVLMGMPRGPHTVPGSKDYSCADCGRTVAIAPSDRRN